MIRISTLDIIFHAVIILVEMTMTPTKSLLLQTHLNQTIIALNPTSMFQYRDPSTLYRTVRNMANIDRPSFIAELSSVSEFSSVDKANKLCDYLHTVLDRRAPPSLRKVITHNSSPWFESIRDELLCKRDKYFKQRGNGGTQS